MPPVLARDMAISLSVTVSIAALKIGILSSISFVSFVFKLTSFGNTLDFCGTNKTSSKVNACLNGGRLLMVYSRVKFFKTMFNIYPDKIESETFFISGDKYLSPSLYEQFSFRNFMTGAVPFPDLRS